MRSSISDGKQTSTNQKLLTFYNMNLVKDESFPIKKGDLKEKIMEHYKRQKDRIKRINKNRHVLTNNAKK